jgi:hypothetical protein
VTFSNEIGTGIVTLVSRHDEVHVDALGSLAVDVSPMRAPFLRRFVDDPVVFVHHAVMFASEAW